MSILLMRKNEMKRFHLMEKIEEAKMHNNDIFFSKTAIFKVWMHHARPF